MRLLAIDAALGPCSTALLLDGICLGIRRGSEGRAAADGLPSLVQALLAEHPGSLGAVAVTVGPGSFTGLRAALAFAHGLALGMGAPVVGVTVMEALLADAAPGRSAWVALDSRRAGRIFLGRDGHIAVAMLDALPAPPGPVAVFGDAAAPVVARLQQAGVDAIAAGSGVVDVVQVGKVALRRLAGMLPPCAAQPLYVALPEARASAGRPLPA